MALDPNKELFLMYIGTVTTEPMIVYPICEAQIALLKTNEALVMISIKYFDFTNFFSEKSATELPKYTKIYTHAIDREKGK